MLHKYTNFFEPPVYFTSLDAGSTKNQRRFTAHRTTAANYLYLNLAPLSRCKAMTPQRSQIRHLSEYNFPGMTHKAPPVGPSCQQEERLIHPGISRDVISQRRSWRLWGNIWPAAPHDTRCKNRNMHALNQMELSLYSFYSFFHLLPLIMSIPWCRTQHARVQWLLIVSVWFNWFLSRATRCDLSSSAPFFLFLRLCRFSRRQLLMIRLAKSVIHLGQGHPPLRNKHVCVWACVCSRSTASNYKWITLLSHSAPPHPSPGAQLTHKRTHIVYTQCVPHNNKPQSKEPGSIPWGSSLRICLCVCAGIYFRKN